MREEELTVKHVQAFVNNTAFPKSLAEVYAYAKDGRYDIEDVLHRQYVGWTVPGWAKKGDIVFFMHAKYARSTITALRTELKTHQSSYAEDYYSVLAQWLERGLDLHKKYGGKIFAIGVILSSPENDSTNEAENELTHWKSRIYASIEILSVLKEPIDISEFRAFIKISRQGAITPVVGNDFKHLRDLISQKNHLPPRIMQCDATPLPLSKINHENWLMVTKDYRRSFLLEIQFRRYYVDYLLRLLGSRKRFYSECRCRKAGAADTFVDNVILLEGRYLPVEVKLSITAQPNLPAQLDQYCGDDEIILDKAKSFCIYPTQVYDNRVLVIDTEAMYLYDGHSKTMEPLCDLDSLSDLEDISKVKCELQKRLN